VSTLREHLSEYLTLRRALGHQLDKLDLLAGQFCDWLTPRARTRSPPPMPWPGRG